MPINGLGARLKRVRSCDHVATRDRIDDQSLGRSCGLFSGSHAIGSRDIEGVEMSRDSTHDRSGDTFPRSCGQRVVLAM